MAEKGLPPGPVPRSWYGKELSLHNFYSIAGVSTSFFAITPKGALILEAGDGCTRDLIELRRSLFPGDEVTSSENMMDLIMGVIVSHPHYDHYAGLLNLLNLFHILGRKEDLKVIYPEGAKAVEMLIDHFLDTLWEECPFEIDKIEVRSPEDLDIHGIKLSTLPVTHRYSRPGAVGGKVPAMAYSIGYGSERIAYTGDTCGSEKLMNFMKGSDLALIEATYGSTPDGHEEVHMDIEKALELARGSKDFWLVHFTARSFNELLNKKGLKPDCLPRVPREGIP